MKRPLCLLLFLVTTAACGSIATPLTGGASATAPTLVGATDSDLVFCVNETNRYRAIAGLPALARSTAAEAFAAVAAAEDARTSTTHNYILNHPPAEGWGENQAMSSGSVRGLINRALAVFWSEGPGGLHYENMVGPFTSLGCGAFNDGSEIRLVQEFRK